MSKKLLLWAALATAVAASTATAQSPRAPQRGPKSSLKVKTEKEPTAPMSLSEMTPEMWLYMQELRRHDDPRESVRRNAEFRADQRRRRIAAREWFGFSNARPSVNPTPWFGEYSPSWGSNDVLRPYRWTANGRLPIYGVRRASTGVW